MLHEKYWNPGFTDSLQLEQCFTNAVWWDDEIVGISLARSHLKSMIGNSERLMALESGSVIVSFKSGSRI